MVLGLRQRRFRGVYKVGKVPGRWKAQIQVQGKHIYLGRYDDETVAARAYDAAATKYFGPGRAKLNFEAEAPRGDWDDAESTFTSDDDDTDSKEDNEPEANRSRGKKRSTPSASPSARRSRAPASRKSLKRTKLPRQSSVTTSEGSDPESTCFEAFDTTEARTPPSSPYRGVRVLRLRDGSFAYRVTAGPADQTEDIGTFADELEAAHAYDEATRRLCGPSAKTNFPPPAPQVDDTEVAGLLALLKRSTGGRAGEVRATAAPTPPAEPSQGAYTPGSRRSSMTLFPRSPGDERAKAAPAPRPLNYEQPRPCFAGDHHDVCDVAYGAATAGSPEAAYAAPSAFAAEPAYAPVADTGYKRTPCYPQASSFAPLSAYMTTPATSRSYPGVAPAPTPSRASSQQPTYPSYPGPQSHCAPPPHSVAAAPAGPSSPASNVVHLQRIEREIDIFTRGRDRIASSDAEREMIMGRIQRLHQDAAHLRAQCRAQDVRAPPTETFSGDGRWFLMTPHPASQPSPEFAPRAASYPSVHPRYA